MAHVIPRSFMCLLVEISESMLCPLIIRVSDIPTTKKATNATARSITISVVDIEHLFFSECKVTQIY